MTFLAQVTGGRSIIQDNIQQIQNVQQAWDKRWLDIFSGTNGLYQGITNLRRLSWSGHFCSLRWLG
jgi:hypothetical protein